jgi:hypothetical protein
MPYSFEDMYQATAQQSAALSYAYEEAEIASSGCAQRGRTLWYGQPKV